MEKLSIILGKSVQALSKIRGGGSALPGLVVEKTSPNFLRKTLAKLPHGVIVISGTNGKTTTTKIVSELLEKQGLKVFTNKTGSNFVRGIISAILQDIKLSGKFDYDIAVLELDEAHAVRFSEQAPINYSLFLNVQRDQLDRFGEIDHTAELLQKVADATQNAIILNREDPRVAKLTGKNPQFFGLSDALLKKFPSDDTLLGGDKKKSNYYAKVVFEKLKGNTASYRINDKLYDAQLKLRGSYNAYNAAGALALCMAVLPKAKIEDMVRDLQSIESAFGRGETFRVDDVDIEVLLVKNPSAFQLSLANFVDDEHDYMICINDRVADGRDVSWLWNVDFSALPKVSFCSGIRATDMALRLKYDEVKVEHIDEDINVAIDRFLHSNKKPKRIFATYTAMLEIRKEISGKSIL